MAISNEERAALLDYYSDMGISHITIFIACLFGIFSILGIVDKNDVFWRNILLTLAYFAMSAGGSYALIRWAYYARISSYIAYELGASLRVMPRDNPRYAYGNWPYFDPEIGRVERLIHSKMRVFTGSRLVTLAFITYVLLCFFSWFAVVGYDLIITLFFDC